MKTQSEESCTRVPSGVLSNRLLPCQARIGKPVANSHVHALPSAANEYIGSTSKLLPLDLSSRASKRTISRPIPSGVSESFAKSSAVKDSVQHFAIRKLTSTILTFSLLNLVVAVGVLPQSLGATAPAMIPNTDVRNMNAAPPTPHQTSSLTPTARPTQSSRHFVVGPCLPPRPLRDLRELCVQKLPSPHPGNSHAVPGV